MALQPIVGFPSSYRAPFSAVEVNFGQGPSTSNGPGRSVIYIGPKTSAGTGIVNTKYRITREQDASDLGGVGSFPHRMCRMHLLADKNATIYLMVYDASSGAGVATATGTITITMSVATNPTATGKIFTTICGEEFETAFKTSDTVTTIGDALAGQINARQFLPLTAANSGGVVTLTAKTAGASSGDGTVPVLRFRVRTELGKNVVVAQSGVALGITTGVAGADGATTETANLTTALATLTGTRHYYMGFSVFTSAAIAPIKTHIVNKSEPNPGLRSIAVTGYNHTQSALTTLAVACNYERRHFAFQENSEHDPSELVANVIAVHRKLESVRGGFVPDNYRGPDWLIKPVYDAADRPTTTEIDDAIVDGISIISSDENGSNLVMSVNSRSKNTAGTIDDFRATERHRVSFMDDFADTWQARDSVTYAGFKLTADQTLTDGSINTNQKVPPRTLTPSRYQPFLNALIDEFANDGVLQNAPAWKESVRVNVDPLNQSRLEAGASGRTMDIRHQVTLRLAETSPG